MVKNFSRQNLKRQKIDFERSLRVVEYIDFPFVLHDSPVELKEGYIVSDRDTYDIFASFVFKNVGLLSIKSLKIRLSCYQNQNIPYVNIDFTYSANDLTFGIISKNKIDLKLRESNIRQEILQGEEFGSCVLIPLPESYFKRMEIYIVDVGYSNGEIENLNIKVAGDSKRFKELDNISKLVYSRVNIYVSAEEKYPTKVIPQFKNNVWLCCCGNKNPSKLKNCEKCGRDKEWLEASVSAPALEKTKQRLVADPTEHTLHDKTNFVQNKYLDNDKDIQNKIEQYEKAMENIACEERRKHKRQMMIVPKTLLWIGAIYLLIFLLEKGIGILSRFK